MIQASGGEKPSDTPEQLFGEYGDNSSSFTWQISSEPEFLNF
jgi:hypothetical protein